jgi:Fe-S-cluster containining protein
MGKSIILDPYDIYIFKKNMNIGFQQLLASNVELNVVDGIILPNLKMDAITDKCVFLDDDGRCSIYNNRPGMCRLFPLGRYYKEGRFKYFLQIYECENKNRSKIKVKNWLDMENVNKHEQYINQWHYFLKDMEERTLKGDDDISKKVNMMILDNFFVREYEDGFYDDFERRIEIAINDN